MNEISVVYHSGYGHTSNQAKGIVKGIESVENVTANLIGIDQIGNITEADWQILDASDAINCSRPRMRAPTSPRRPAISKPPTHSASALPRLSAIC